MSDFMARIAEFSQKRLALLALELQSKLETIERSKTEPVAIIGIGCRFPGHCNDPESFWKLLRDGIDPITEVPVTRWDIDAYYDPNPDTPGKTYSRWGGFLDEVDKFDAEFFGISAQEAVSMDPQQRLLLEVSWEALEHAGQAPRLLVGSSTGVFVGIGTSDYAIVQVKSANTTCIDAYTGYGSGFCFAAGRLSYVLGLQGPSMAIDAACASSSITVHLACQSLRSHECKLALACGVNLILSPEANVIFSKTRRISASGRCKTFDSGADGYVRSEGCGVVVLKRLSDAVADGDNILALVRGSAVNHGGASGGLTIPNRVAQQSVIQEALARAGVEAARVSYVEVQGTGTPVGDPIEVRALGAVLGEGRRPADPLALGSVKTNIGNPETASGMAGLIKVVLALQHEELPPHLHLRQLNAHISLDDIPAWIPVRRTPWPTGGQRRIAGVNSFGASGTNSHLVIEEAPTRGPISPGFERPLHLLGLSAKSPSALRELGSRYERYLGTHPSASLGDICFTAGAGRSHFDHRIAFIGKSVEVMHQQLVAFAADAGDTTTQALPANRPRVAFLFPGDGSQYDGMGRQLYETQPTFCQALKHCDTLLRPHLDSSLLSVLYPVPGSASRLDETAYAQTAVFAVEYALAMMWQSWGIRPDIVLGRGAGEYVAACIAGVFSLEDGLKMVAKEGQLIQALPPNGMMATVLTEEARVTDAIASYHKEISIAEINGPRHTVIAGGCSAVHEVLAQLRSEGVHAAALPGSHALHSFKMGPILDDFNSVVETVNYVAPTVRMVSNVSGQILSQNYVPDSDYWRRHIIEPIRFYRGITTLVDQGYDCFLEVGPKSKVLEIEELSKEQRSWLFSLDPEREDWSTLLESLRALYVRGLDVDWIGFDRDYRRCRVPLPTYPFERKRYWPSPAGGGQ